MRTAIVFACFAYMYGGVSEPVSSSAMFPIIILAAIVFITDVKGMFKK